MSNIFLRIKSYVYSSAMCKFNQNLFLVTICGFALIELLTASPVDLSFLDDIMDGSSSYDINPNHDLKYDQRQNGTENLRLNLDGVIIAFPASTSNQATNAAANVAANYLLQLAAASEEDEDNEYFPFLKNSNQNGISASNDKETVAAQPFKDDKNSKKKSSPPGGAPAKEPEKIVVVKEIIKNADEIADTAAAGQQAISTVEQQQQAKIEVIPVKKVQSRRKNK